jgi:uncharacterized protein (TIGR02284 family)
VSVDSRVSKDLVETLQDGRKGFADAAERLTGSDHAAWATTLRRFSDQRAQFASELEQLGAAYGDDVENDGSAAAKAHRGWMALKDALTGAKPDGVIDACISGEDHAVSEYEDAVGQDLSEGLRTVVQRQLGEIQAARTELKGLQHATD